MGLFDTRNFFEVTHPDFPGERLVACLNPELAKRRAAKRQSLLEATTKELERVRQMVNRGRLQDPEAIREQVQQVLAKYRIRRYYTVNVSDHGLVVEVDEKQIAAALAGLASPAQAQAAHERYERHRKAIDKQLARIRRRMNGGELFGRDAIGVRVGKVLEKYKVGKHFTLTIRIALISKSIRPRLPRKRLSTASMSSARVWVKR